MQTLHTGDWSQNNTATRQTLPLRITQVEWRNVNDRGAMCHAVLTTGGGAVLVLCISRLLFLLSSSLTGSLTRTPWYGLGLASADDGARERNWERRSEREVCTCYVALGFHPSHREAVSSMDEFTVLISNGLSRVIRVLWNGKVTRCWPQPLASTWVASM